jgi:hypothetical protein
LPDTVEVRDPAHPLFGRRFTVLRRPMDGSGGLPPCYEVDHIAGSTLLVPVRATEEYQFAANQIKLSVEGVMDLLVVAESIEANDDKAAGSLGLAVAERATPDRRRRRGGHSGDLL